MDRKRNSRERDIDLESKRSRTQESRSPSFEYDEDITYYEDSRSPLSGQDHDYADTDFFPLAKGGGDGTDRKKRRYRVMADASKDERRTRDERKHRSDRSNRERRDQHQRSPQQHSSSSSRKSHVRPTASSEHISPHSFEAKRSQDWQNWDRSAPSHRYPDREGHRHVERVRHSREQHRGERRGSGPIVLRGHRYQREEEDMQRSLSPNRDEATHMRQRERRGEANICRSLSPFRTDYHSSRGRRLMKEDGKFVQRRSDSPLSEHLEKRGRREHMRGRSRGNEERGILHRVESGSERSEGDGGVSDDGRCGDERLELRGESLDQFIKDLESNSSSSSEPEDRDMQHRKETVSHSDSSTGEVYSDNEDGHFQPHSQSQSQSRSRSQSHSQSPESGEGRHPHVMRSKFDSDDDGEEEEEEVSEEDPNLPPHEGYQETPPGEDRADLQHQQELKEEEEEAKKEEEAAENQKLSAKFSEELAMEDDEEEEKEGAVYLPQLMGCRNVESFEWLNRIEEGTYGVVHRAKDKKTGEIVALKKLKMENEKEGFPITSLREISTLLKARHPNIVHLKEVVVGSNMNKIFIVMEYVEHDLKALMETMMQPFLLGEVKTLMIQLLRAVHHLHDNWILHRDLKASNLLLSHKGILKVGDFGLAREYGSPLKPYTPIVVTLWYRAPELLLGTKEYSTAIDMWSVGCIFAEFLQKKPLFRGRSEIDQINLIFKELGTPNERIWPGYNKLPTVEKVTFTHHPYNNLRKKFPSSFLTENGFNLLNRFLTYDPKKRIVASESLDHQFFKEPPMPVPPSMFPTWPAKSEMTRGKRREKSPKPPEGAINLLVGDDDKVGPVGPSAAPAGPGFSLKF